MTGLEKITGRIIAEAKAEADKVIKDAKAQAEAIITEYNEKSEEASERISQDADIKCADIISRAKSTVTMTRRNILLQAQSEIIDGVFEAAMKEIIEFPREKYCRMLVSLLANALLERLDAEKTNMELYGEEDLVDKYEIILNKKDRNEFGSVIIDELRRKVIGKIDAPTIEKVVLSDSIADINGGIILKCGNIECNASISRLFTELRPKLEAEVSRILFNSAQ